MNPSLKTFIGGLAAACLVASAAGARQDLPGPEDPRAARIPAHPRDLLTPPLQPFRPPAPTPLELDRGARLLVIENHELPLIDGSLLFRGAGSASDPLGRAGLAELLADALRAGGSKSTPGTELDDKLDAYAATLTVSVEPDAMRIDFSCLSADLDVVLEAIGRLLVIPAYPEGVIEKSRKRLETRLRGREADTRYQADAGLLRAIYGADARAARQPTARSVDAITREELVRFHTDHLGVDRLVVGVIGDVQAATLGAQIETLFTRLPRAKAKVVREPLVFLQPTRTRIYLLDWPDARQSEVRFAAPGTRHIDRDFPALNLWSYAIGYGSASNRMMLKLRTELGLIYSGALYYETGWGRAGRLEAYLSTRNGAVGEAVSTLQELLADGLEPLPEEELETVRARVQRAEVFQVDRPRKVLARALELEFHGHDAEFWTRHAERIGELDSQEVSAAVGRHLDPERLVIVAVGPREVLLPQLEPLGEVVVWTAPEADAENIRERLFESSGGRELWRETRYVETEVEVVRSGQPAIIEHGWRDLEESRLRVEESLGEASSTLILGTEGGWLSAGDSILALPQDELLEQLAHSDRQLFRILAQLAKLDVSELRASGGVRLEILSGPLSGSWLEVNDAGHPTRFGYELQGADFEYELSGWTELAGVFSPTEILDLTTSKLRRVRSIALHAELAEELFSRP